MIDYIGLLGIFKKTLDILAKNRVYKTPEHSNCFGFFISYDRGAIGYETSITGSYG